MPKTIYGVDPTKEVKPIDVRDAIVECFTQAHDHVMSQSKGVLLELTPDEFEEIKKLNVKTMVESMFEKIGADFNKPTKESMIQVCDQLREFAKNFRDEKMIARHYQEIMKLIEKL